MTGLHTTLRDKLHEIPFEAEDILRRFCLQAFSLKAVEPLWFDIRVEWGRLTIQIPNYMRIDWSRHFPVDVVNVLQERLDLSITPQRTSVATSLINDLKVWALFAIVAASLLNKHDAGARKAKLAPVLETLNRTALHCSIPISMAEGSCLWCATPLRRRGSPPMIYAA